jgi:dynein heavy chain
VTDGVEQAILELHNLVGGVKNSAQTIQGIVDSIARAVLVTEPPADADALDVQELLDIMERHRITVLDGLVRKYKMITALLGKIETTVEVCGGARQWVCGFRS